MKSILKKTITFLTCCLLFASCSNDSSDNNDIVSGSRHVKYELSGTYTGTLIVVYINEDGVYQTLDNISLPWSKEVTIKGNSSDYTTAVLNGNSEVGGFGQAGETITAKIFTGNTLKKSATVDATNSGYVDIGVTYLLQ